MRNPAVFLTVLAVFAFHAAPALALASAWRSADHLQARLLTAVDTTGEAGGFDGALEVRTEEGWHIYWRMPGEAGQEPILDWKSSTNVSDVTFGWPAPQRFSTAGLQSFGYTGLVAFPFTAKLGTSGRPVLLSLAARILACKDICVPQTLTLTLPVPAGTARTAAEQAPVTQAQAKVPADTDTAELKIQSAVAGPDALVANVFSQHGFNGVDLFVEPADLNLFQPPQITPNPKDPRTATLRIPKGNVGDNLAKQVMGHTMILTLVSPNGAVEKKISF
jgi:suppressor for copper-sensitivity B